MALMGFREYARHRGCTLQAVQKAIDSGRISVCYDQKGKKKIESVAADTTWRERTDPAKQSLLYAAGPTPNTSSPSEDVSVGQGEGALVPSPATSGKPEDDPADEPGDDHQEKYRENRAENERIRTRRAAIELAQLEGSVISLEVAQMVAATSFRTLRDAILNVPARIKDQCASETDPYTIEALIEAELTSVLSSFNPSVLPAESDQDDDDAG